MSRSRSRCPTARHESSKRDRRRPRSRPRSGRASPRRRWPRRPTASGSISIDRSIMTSRCRSWWPTAPTAARCLRHSTAHVLAEAVTRLFPGAKYAIGPAIADGFYYDFELPGGQTFSEDDLARIEAEMRDIVKQDQRFEREELSYDDALKVFADQPYKREIIEKVRAGEASGEDAGEAGGPDGSGEGVSVYRNLVDGEVRFVDLCRGPHVPSTQAARRVQAHQGRGRVLARQREGPDAATHLRHRVGVEGGARRAPASARGGRAPRPPQARRRARPVLVPRGDRFGPGGVPSRRARSCAASWRSTRASGTRRRATCS